MIRPGYHSAVAWNNPKWNMFNFSSLLYFAPSPWVYAHFVLEWAFLEYMSIYQYNCTLYKVSMNKSSLVSVLKKCLFSYFLICFVFILYLSSIVQIFFICLLCTVLVSSEKILTEWCARFESLRRTAEVKSHQNSFLFVLVIC